MNRYNQEEEYKAEEPAFSYLNTYYFQNEVDYDKFYHCMYSMLSKLECNHVPTSNFLVKSKNNIKDEINRIFCTHDKDTYSYNTNHLIPLINEICSFIIDILQRLNDKVITTSHTIYEQDARINRINREVKDYLLGLIGYQDIYNIYEDYSLFF